MKSPPDGGRYRWRIERVQDGIETYPDLPPSAGWAVDTRSLIRHLAADVAAGVPAAVIARRFHSSVVDLVTLVCAKIRAATGLSQVVLSGGVFMNALLTSEARAQLSADGFTVYCHEQTPANDGGLSLGQLAIAAATLC
jgi:hydrogenase maturation protein HypF